MKEFAQEDPRGLILEAYRIEGITLNECRTIFLDWALSLADGANQRDAVSALLDRHRDEAKDHPMSQVLTEAMAAPPAARRRGGFRGRRRA